MKYRPLGSTGTQVSVLCLGAMTFGTANEKSFMHKVGSDEADSFAVMDRAMEAGVKFIDTADGGEMPHRHDHERIDEQADDDRRRTQQYIVDETGDGADPAASAFTH